MSVETRTNKQTGEVAYKSPDGRWIIAETKRNKRTGEVAYRGPDDAWRLASGSSRENVSRSETADIALDNVWAMGARDEVAATTGTPKFHPAQLAETAGKYAIGKVRQALDPEEKHRAETRKDALQQRHAQAQKDNPWTYGGTTAAAYLMPGAAGWKAGAAATRGGVGMAQGVVSRALPGASLVEKGGRYAARLAPKMAGTAASIGGFNATVGKGLEEAKTGKDVSMGDRVEAFTDAMKRPINYAFGAAPSLAYRAGIAAKSGGRNFTPRSVQRETGVITERASDVILDATRQDLGIPRSSHAALREILVRAGYSGDDIDRGVVSISDRLNSAHKAGDRTSLFALELQKEFPHATQNIKDVFQQLATAPPKQGATARGLTKALDDQFDSQRTHFDGVAQEKLGTAKVADELKWLAEARGQIGKVRDRTIEFASTDRRGIGQQAEMRGWVDEYGNDREVMNALRAAARELGYKGNKEVAEAVNRDPARLLQKFGEIAGAEARANRASPVLQRARQESENLFDELSRWNREADSFAFAKRAEGPIGPYKQQQAKFRENYSQEDTLLEARNRFQQARDPVKADAFVDWYKSLPEGDQGLVKTVVRQDMEKMLRGGNIDDAGAYLTNLRKEGVHDVLVKILGKDGEDISRAIRQLADEQTALKEIDPRKGLQSRTVRGAAADRARNLYTTNPIAQMGDRLPNAFQLGDVALMSQGQLPWITIAKQATKIARPSSRTREGLGELLAMRRVSPARPPVPNALTPGPAPAAVAGPSGGGPPNVPAVVANPAAQTVTRPSPRAVQLLPKMEASVNAAKARAEQRLGEARLKLDAARQARAAQPEIRKLEVEAATAEREARRLMMEAKADKTLTQDAVRGIRRRSKQGVRDDRRQIAQESRERRIQEEARLSRDQIARDAEQERVLVNMEGETQALRGEAASIATTEKAALQAQQAAARQETATRMSQSGVSWREIYDVTGLLDIRIGGKSVLIDPGKHSPTKVFGQLHRDAAKDPSKWSPTTRQIARDTGGESGITEAFGNNTLPGSREAARSSGARTIAKATAGAAGATAVAGYAGYGVHKYREGQISKAEREAAARTQFEQRTRRWVPENRDEIVLAQAVLKAQGFYLGDVDGRWGERSSTALFNFQRSNGLRETGQMDEETAMAISRAAAQADLEPAT
ncbi:MAG: peptidoglycan-binding domain-containing protein [Pseudomonadota bacterium]